MTHAKPKGIPKATIPQDSGIGRCLQRPKGEGQDGPSLWSLWPPEASHFDPFSIWPK